MAIKFDADLNKELRRKVDAFNKRRKRAEARGLKYLPPKQSIKELKAYFGSTSATRDELRRKFKELDSFNVKSASQLLELESGEKTSAYLYKDAMKKRNRLLKLYTRKAEEQRKFIRPEYPFTKSLFNTYVERIKSLAKPIKSRDDLRKYSAYYKNEYSPTKLDNFFGHTLNAIEEEMKFIDFPAEKREYILNKLKKTSPDVILKIYRNHPTFNVIDIRYTTDGQYTQEDEMVFSDLYDNLYENIDDIINEFTFEDYEIL